MNKTENHTKNNDTGTSWLDDLKHRIDSGEAACQQDGLMILSRETDLDRLVAIASIPRFRHFQNGVRLHILNNVQNGLCSEDCNYCAQRNDTDAERIPEYSTKPDSEIFEEAQEAYSSGAFRYCMVFSGRGPDPAEVSRYAAIVKRLKKEFPGMEICLSAGLLSDGKLARELKEAGLDRYNHNLNSSIAHYDQICTTHEYSDRLQTIDTLKGAGVQLCSGVIVGMGERDEDLITMALELKRQSVVSIPVNFFLPVPGHRIHGEPLTSERCLRVLILFRLFNPDAEIRIAAGRETYLAKDHRRALMVANSLFVSGYLNVEGAPLFSTLKEIELAGMEVDAGHSDRSTQLALLMEESQGAQPEGGPPSLEKEERNKEALKMKSYQDLRPFSRKGNG